MEKKVRLTMNKGLLIILSAPSGCGKDAILEALAGLDQEFHRSLSATTRAPREKETHGVDYLFLSDDEFQRLIEENGLLEYAEFGNHYYGTPRAPVDRWLSQGETVILKIETQGADKVREMYPEAVGIFIIPPSLAELENRLRGRGTDSEESILLRLETAKAELKKAGTYDYIVVNDDLQTAAQTVCSIIVAERCKAGHMKDLIEEVLENAES